MFFNVDFPPALVDRSYTRVGPVVVPSSFSTVISFGSILIYHE